ncbi:PepSY-like domain-containing protein [Campylobacter sp. MIT 21-1685]|uniref:PepSY-like domain-containing protein n=1 Tax=unclassified Campylobacter TaxID=2593542 RepID=UPI00224B84B9|nr:MULTISPECIES: PepSY-like domain-containing protein [unclassified Campylobacter]MCX2682581.1 PepSY-like domain-containing protein [Campylobacter sp. MIT 21-1684]MCX2750861.1 PepSY-like domain-containing protein [Campylobacter sp. MIT 21-1682]MCX2807206.1 PepSY-like domain-containing protein [Campylobacter sp. MIT 21-1685]
MKIQFTLASLLCTAILYASDMIVPATALPQNAQNFIHTYFKGIQISLVKQDLDSFDVVLNDGTEIDFVINGEWEEVDGKYKAIPTDFLPAQIVNTVKATQPNAQILKVEKKIQGYKFNFNNRMEVYTDFNGNVLGQKFDD